MLKWRKCSLCGYPAVLRWAHSRVFTTLTLWCHIFHTHTLPHGGSGFYRGAWTHHCCFHVMSFWNLCYKCFQAYTRIYRTQKMHLSLNIVLVFLTFLYLKPFKWQIVLSQGIQNNPTYYYSHSHYCTSDVFTCLVFAGPTAVAWADKLNVPYDTLCDIIILGGSSWLSSSSW